MFDMGPSAVLLSLSLSQAAVPMLKRNYILKFVALSIVSLCRCRVGFVQPDGLL